MTALHKQAYVREFELVPWESSKLQDFFDQHPAMLKTRYGPTTADEQALKDLIMQVMPEDIMAALKDVFAGKADYAIAIKGLPEAKGLEHLPAASIHEAQFYSYHLGKALYAACGIQPAQTFIHTRHKNGQPTKDTIIHRDTTENKRICRYSEHIILSVAHNAEEAPTQIVNLKQAIESIPLEWRKKMKVMVSERVPDQYGGFSRMHEVSTRWNARTLQEVLDYMYNPINGSPDNIFVQKIKLCPFPDEEEKRVFLNAIEEHGEKYTIQPGTLLILNEGKLFHCALPGAVQSIPAQMPNTRVLLHHAGVPLQR